MDNQCMYQLNHLPHILIIIQQHHMQGHILQAQINGDQHVPRKLKPHENRRPYPSGARSSRKLPQHTHVLTHVNYHLVSEAPNNRTVNTHGEYGTHTQIFIYANRVYFQNLGPKNSTITRNSHSNNKFPMGHITEG